MIVTAEIIRTRIHKLGITNQEIVVHLSNILQDEQTIEMIFSVPEKPYVVFNTYRESLSVGGIDHTEKALLGDRSMLFLVTPLLEVIKLLSH